MSIIYTELLSYERVHELEPWHWLVHTAELIELNLSTVQLCIMRLINKESRKKRPGYMALSKYGPEIIARFHVRDLCHIDECTALFGKVEKLKGFRIKQLLELCHRHMHLVLLEWMFEYWTIDTEDMRRMAFKYIQKCAEEGKLKFLDLVIVKSGNEWRRYKTLMCTVIEGKAHMLEKAEYIRSYTEIHNGTIDRASLDVLRIALIEYGDVDLVKELVQPTAEEGSHSWIFAKRMEIDQCMQYHAGSMKMYTWMKANGIEVAYDSISVSIAMRRGDAELVMKLLTGMPCVQFMTRESIAYICENSIYWAMNAGSSKIAELLIETYPQDLWYNMTDNFRHIVGKAAHILATKLLRNGMVTEQMREQVYCLFSGGSIRRDTETDFIIMVDLLKEHGIDIPYNLSMIAYDTECDKLIKHLWNHHRGSQDWMLTSIGEGTKSRRFMESMGELGDVYITR